ncbi:MAG: GatB/YqeY domain-containing protein [Porphyromonadaceae bacterium]|nr:GatB/YqeY domain-containing protein [Porphyromonadaceae bacterium]
MTIFDRISDDIKKAMIAQNKVELLALRNIKKELIEAKTSKEVAGNLTDEIALRIIYKIVKQNKDAAAVFIEQNRSDLAEEYMAQAEVIQRYMPAQMSDAELTVAVKEIISHTGACSLKDLGKVMCVASKQLAGKAEGRAISDKVKELLS